MIAAIVQARTGSSRLPNKVLMEIKNRPILWYVVHRLKKAQQIQDIIIATTENPQDDIIQELCDDWNLKCHRGSEDDVLDRYYEAAKKYDVENIVRVTADCPLIDFRVVDEVIGYFQSASCDYASNTLERGYPDGMDTEVFTFSALEKAWKAATLKSEREHVTPYIWENSTLRGKERFVAGNYGFDHDFSHFRLTVDEKEDFEVVRFLIENTDLDTPWLTYIALLTKHTDVMLKNAEHIQNEGYQKSLLEDKWAVTGSDVPISKSLAMQERAKQRIPGMTQLLSKRPDQFSMGVWPGYYSKAKGVKVWDLDGKQYADMSIGGIGANILGYADPDVDAAVSTAIRMGMSCSLNCAEEVELADLLCDIHPWAEKVRYSRTGGESMTIAVRIARAYTGRDKIAFCGYHGWHDWYLAANLQSENALGEHLLPGLDPRGVPKALGGTALPFRYNHLNELEDIVSKHRTDIAAIVMEPIRNDPPESGFLEGVRALADEIGAVLIVDEISSGFRMNSGGAHLLLGLEPDIAVFSKAMGNGYPIGAVIGKGEIMQAAQSTFISSTCWTERVGPTAALATIRKHQDVSAGEHLMKMGEQVQTGWKNVAEKYGVPVHVGGIFPLSHFAFDGENALAMKALFVQLMLGKGFLASTSFYAMYAHQDKHVALYLNASDEVFKQIAEAQKKGEVENMLKGQPSAAGFKRLI